MSAASPSIPGPTLLAQSFSRRQIGKRIVLVATLFWFAGLVLLPNVISLDASEPDRPERLLTPSRAHLLGTDDQGRDLLARIFEGAVQPIQVAALTVVLTLAVALILGASAAYCRPLALIANRIAEAANALPPLLLILALFAVQPVSWWLLYSCLVLCTLRAPYEAVSHWTKRQQTALATDVSRASGMSEVAIFCRRTLPVLFQTVFLYAPSIAVTAIVTDATLSFLGLNVDPGATTWGGTISASRAFIQQAPLVCFAPAGILIVTLFLLQQSSRGLIDNLPPEVEALLPPTS